MKLFKKSIYYFNNLITIVFSILALFIVVIITLVTKIDNLINPNINLDSIEDTIIDDTIYTVY